MDGLLTPLPLLLFAAALVLVLPIVRRRPPVRERTLDRFAARVDLPVPDGDREDLAATLTARTIAVEVGAALGVAVAGLAAWALPLPTNLPAGDDGSSPLWALVVAGTAIAGGALGAGTWATRRAARPVTTEGPRLARPVAPTVGDYVSPPELVGARVVALVPPVLVLAGGTVAVTTDVLRSTDVLTAPALIAAAVALLALVVGEVAARRLLDQPQIAGSRLELAWSDAVRARVLRDVISAPLAIGIYATFAVLVAASGAVDDPSVANAIVGVLGLVTVAVFLTALASLASSPQRHFRRRLWPSGPTPVPAPTLGPR